MSDYPTRDERYDEGPARSESALMPGYRELGQRAYSFAADALERAGWTAAQAGIGVLVVATADIPPWLAVPIATGLAVAKAFVARQLARKGTASTAPGV